MTTNAELARALRHDFGRSLFMAQSLILSMRIAFERLRLEPAAPPSEPWVARRAGQDRRLVLQLLNTLEHAADFLSVVVSDFEARMRRLYTPCPDELQSRTRTVLASATMLAAAMRTLLDDAERAAKASTS